MTILVTGGGGFLGRGIVRRLLDRNEHVRVLARQRYEALEALGVESVQGDVSDASAVERAVRGVAAVFHVAARVGYWGPLREYHATNVDGTRILLASARAAGAERFVYTSTPSVVLGPESNVEGGDETLPYIRWPHYAYGSTKAEAEALVLGSNATSFRTCALRPHFIFGPGDPHIVPRLIGRARAGKLFRVGDGTNRVDVTYIDNAVDAHVAALDALGSRASPACGRAYFIGNAEPVRLWSFIDDVLSGFGVPPVTRSIPVALAYGMGAAFEKFYSTFRLRGEPPMTRMAAVMLGRSHYFSHARAEDDLGYRPRVTTVEGLERIQASPPVTASVAVPAA